ncbi:ceroid-lipofuscinosis neuronal protein 5 homolog [Aplysia californica]|uniref:Bis(monoacylglycero)phosphate synthase CLN5 n=1 Tax=Aplysia californica TaxID=6500 RepID=A0ABM1AAC0_APLCA|nr:ceroid-lipofuscinosis neuronal protein 5 homolog [Aplysia californica]
MSQSLVLLSSCIMLFFVSTVMSSYEVWPQPHRKYNGRPPTGAPYCQAGVIPFCPTGLRPNYMPTVKPDDELIVYAMKAPVWEFKFGSLLEKFHIMHDAIGFHHVQSGLNLTMEWYELFQLFNCTFPHEPKAGTLRWCNQGATCIYMGIDAKHWKENGTLAQVAEISGDVFNKFANWTETDNSTYPFYETWTVREKAGNNTVWFNPFDCASWVLRAFEKMHEFGAEFNQFVHLNYTKISLISGEPQYVGNSSTIYEDPDTLKKLIQFYSNFQHYDNYFTMLENLLLFIMKFVVDDTFYLFYNDQYWKLPLKSPYIELTYDEVPLPS